MFVDGMAPPAHRARGLAPRARWIRQRHARPLQEHPARGGQAHHSGAEDDDVGMHHPPPIPL